MTAPAPSRNPLAGLPAFRAGPSALVVAAPAKLNLFLEVVAKRPDGYHDLESLMVGIDLFDTLELHATASGEVELVCEPPGLSTGPDNLVHKAANALKAHTGRGDLSAHVRLTKRVPMQAGLGGGSSDAAAAIAGLNEIWKLGLTRETLHAIAASVGSDVAFFHSLPAAWCTGRGEVTAPEPAPANGFDFVLVCPAVGLATAGVFKRLTVPAVPVSGDAVRKAFSAGDPAAIGIEIVLAIIMGSGAGYWADGKWGTAPWLTVLGFCFGCGAAAKAVARVIKDFERNNPDSPAETTSRGAGHDDDAPPTPGDDPSAPPEPRPR